ncbi:MAG: RNA polymerase factor sigma-54 [Candidatus Aminicenantia bacterium]
MVIKQKLEQKQIQKLILTPALQQAIQLLPLTNLELIEVINLQLAQNPLLELEEEIVVDQNKSKSATQPEKEESSETLKELREKTIDSKIEKEVESTILKEESDTSKEDIIGEADLFYDYLDSGFSPHFTLEEKEFPSLENTASRSPSLWDHLNWQANLTFFNEEEKKIAQLIIGNINQDGYLEVSVEELAQMTGQKKKEEIEKVREVIKRFDPIGVGSINLQECLLTQMEQLKIEDKIAIEIVKKHLHLLETHNYKELAKILEISLPELKSHIEVIKNLDPTPGSKYLRETSDYIVPDILVEKEENVFKIILNNERVPRLKINSYYKKLLSQATKENSEIIKYLEGKFKSALWFLRSLEQRNQTILKVAQYIVNKQKDFLEKGIDWIKPLTLAEVAEAIKVHESTVSRVVANKYMLTPQGIFSLKYFFHKGITDLSGQEISCQKIKEKINTLIEKEEPHHPFSDAEIVEILAKSGIKVARRTVAKYRKLLKIPSSHIRKRNILMEEIK